MNQRTTSQASIRHKGVSSIIVMFKRMGAILISCKRVMYPFAKVGYVIMGTSDH